MFSWLEYNGQLSNSSILLKKKAIFTLSLTEKQSSTAHKLHVHPSTVSRIKSRVLSQ
ncbi:hypothetical protein BT96DRAFT_430440 [Gymnopus androsaceus JB14]|uniref:Uncharacterized protein n=1 Tax=Gymnopus androsaceus JB14 TaxID=1447944 RepID=A0A6A4GTS5_9AGAR|nr:hypothetical protein BT96DRAFT_430440 [Gymnopus androsaceus JB14]